MMDATLSKGSSGAGSGSPGPADVEFAIEARGLTKVYGPTIALAGADLTTCAGEIHALLGENGAGKSTLVRLLAGLEVQDAGELRLFGRPPDPAGMHVAGGCEFIHQDLGLFPTASVAENIALGSVTGFSRRAGLIDDRATMRSAQQLLDRLGMGLDARTLVGELPIADQTAVAIARALSSGVRLIVLDEPTAYLEASQVRSLLTLLRRLRDENVACLLITHRASDVLTTCDRVTVLREGRTVAERPVEGLTVDELVRLISGRSAERHRETVARTTRTRRVIELREATGPGFGPVSISIHAGEVVGLCGLADAGTSDVGKVMFGLEALSSGVMLRDDQPYAPTDAAAAMDAGVGYVPSDRRTSALALDLTARENLFMRPAAAWHRPLRVARERRAAAEIMEDLGVRPNAPEHLMSTFSGGNQQKVVLGSWIKRRPDLLVLNEPTAGVDLGAKAEIHAHIARGCERDGFGVLLISSDFNEIVELADRIYVMHRQCIVAEVDGATATADQLVSLAYGREAAS